MVHQNLVIGLGSDPDCSLPIHDLGTIWKKALGNGWIWVFFVPLPQVYKTQALVKEWSSKELTEFEYGSKIDATVATSQIVKFRSSKWYYCKTKVFKNHINIM